MPLPDRFTHWLQAEDDAILGYDAAEDDLMLPAVEDLVPRDQMPWRDVDMTWAQGYVPEDE